MQQVESSAANSAPQPMPFRGSVEGAALRLALGTLASRIFGLIRDIVLAAFFSRLVTDAFVVAFRLPNFFRRLIGEGSIAGAFTPLYVADRAHSAALTRAVFAFLFSLSATLTVLGILFMRPLLELLVATPEFMATPGKFELTLWLGRVMFTALFLITNYAFFSALAHIHGRFFWPAVAPAIFNLAVIAAAVLARQNGHLLAWGVVVGGLLQNAITIWALRGVLTDFHGVWRVSWIEIKPFLDRLVPTVMGLGGAQAIALLNVYFAAALPGGTLSYVYLGDRLLDLPMSLVAVSLGSALLPRLSSLWHKGDRRQFSSEFIRQIEVLLLLVLPSAVGLYLLAEPIVTALFQHGHFVSGEVTVTAQIVVFNAAILLFIAITRLLVVALHAMSSYGAPAFVSLCGAAIHFIVAAERVQARGFVGLMQATLISSAVIALGNIILFLRGSGDVRTIFGRLTSFLLRLTLPLLLLAGFVLFTSASLGAHRNDLLGVLLTVVGGAAIYFFICKFVGVFRHLESADSISK